MKTNSPSLSLKHAWKPSRKTMAAVQIAILLVGVLAPMHQVYAAQLDNRALSTSSSVASAASVTYEYSYQVTTDGSDLGSFKFEVCTNDPFPDTSCTSPSGFDASGAGTGNTTVTVGGTSQTLAAVNTASTDAGTTNEIEVQLDTAVSSVASGTEVVVTFDSTITNPDSSNTEYFSRLYTYSDTGNSTKVDDGGLAFSTAESVDVTARVQETLTFCVFADGASCASPGDTSVDLGVLTTSTGNTGTHKAQAATNALNGYVLQYAGTTLTHSNGTDTIDAIGATGTTSSPGSEQFGMNIAVSNSPSNSSTLDGDYSGSNYAFVDGATVTDGTDSTADNTLATSSGPIDSNVYDLEFLGNVSATTPTGTYDTTVTYVATATY